MAGAYPGFFSMKHLASQLHPPPTPRAVCCWYPHLGEERQSGVKVLVYKKQRNRQGLNPRPPDAEFEVLITRPHMPPLNYVGIIHKKVIKNINGLFYVSVL